MSTLSLQFHNSNNNWTMASHRHKRVSNIRIWKMQSITAANEPSYSLICLKTWLGRSKYLIINSYCIVAAISVLHKDKFAKMPSSKVETAIELQIIQSKMLQTPQTMQTILIDCSPNSATKAPHLCPHTLLPWPVAAAMSSKHSSNQQENWVAIPRKNTFWGKRRMWTKVTTDRS